MLRFIERSDEKFVRDALDASKRAEVLRRERRNQGLSVIAGLVAIAVWLLAQWDWLLGDADRSGHADFIFFCLVIMVCVGSVHARSNVRLLRGLQLLEEKLTSAIARKGGAS